MLGLHLREGEAFSIGEDICVLVKRATGSHVWVGVYAPETMRIDRTEQMPLALQEKVKALTYGSRMRDRRSDDPLSNLAGQLRRALENGGVGGMEDAAYTLLAHLESIVGQQKIAG